MNVSTISRNGYSAGLDPIRTPRSVEYDVFARVTGSLKRAQTHAQCAGAIADNRSLWTALAADVSDPDNGLPAQLRGQIFYLAEFTEHHSRKVLRGEATPDALVDINTAVMSGLRPGGPT